PRTGPRRSSRRQLIEGKVMLLRKPENPPATVATTLWAVQRADHADHGVMLNWVGGGSRGRRFDGPFAVGTSTAELFDPASLTFTTLPAMTSVRFSHTATLLTDGMVLLAGANDGGFLVLGG